MRSAIDLSLITTTSRRLPKSVDSRTCRRYDSPSRELYTCLICPTSTMDSKTVNAVVTLTANTTNTSPLTSVVCTPNNDTGSNTVTLYKTGANESDKLLTTSFQDLATCYAPAINQQLKLTAVYDVYDKSGTNLIRENCNAENIFTPIVQESDLKPGKRHTIRITVNPTYLYVLSDPDLDNPTITVN